MSLINDALQRAKKVQQAHPPATADLPLRPIDPAQQPPRGPGLVLPATMAVVVIVGILSWWFLNLSSHSVRLPESTPTVAAKAARAPVVSSSPAPVPAAAPAPAAPAPTNDSASMIPAKTVEPPVAPASSDAPGREAGAPAEAAKTPEVAKPPLPKLQAITYYPARPSAIINGKTVYVGDRFREFRVLQIEADSATLVNGTQTNVLTMD
jgi:cytoskeletal protein RodZ